MFQKAGADCSAMLFTRRILMQIAERLPGNECLEFVYYMQFHKQLHGAFYCLQEQELASLITRLIRDNGKR